MPIYDFKCESCGARYEVRTGCTVHSIKCPCGSRAVRQPSAPSFIIKGYTAKTGYATKEESEK